MLPKLFRPTVRKNCSSDQEKLLKFKAEGRDFAKFLRSIEQFMQKLPILHSKKSFKRGEGVKNYRFWDDIVFTPKDTDLAH